MSFISSWILLNVFTALLPPIDPNEEDYYSRLGLDRRKKVTADEIRKAFRSKSLQWHPDKIAQRGQSQVTAAEAAAKFQGIQEAYQVLSDPEKRQNYHFWNCSVVRYQFVHSNMANPAALYHNLASARIRDKARLVAVVGVLLIVLIMPFILVASKVNQTLDDNGGLRDASWAALLTPIWIAFAVSFSMVGVAMYVTKSVSLVQIIGLMERACWLAALVLLVQRWDGNRQIKSWHAAAIPFYFAAAFRILGQVVWMGVIQQEINKMISVEHLQKVEAEMLDGASIEDLTEEELMALHSRYHVVNPDPMQVVAALEILKAQDIDLRVEGQEEELEAVRVQCSPEYQAAAEQIIEARIYAAHVLFFGIPLIPLTAAKLNGDITASWWVVILPLWLYWTSRLARVCTLCLGYSGGEDVVVVDAADDENDNKDMAAARAAPATSAPASSVPGNINGDSSNTAETNPEKSMAPVAEEEEEEEEQDEEAQNTDNPFPTPYNMTKTPYVPEDDEILSEAPSDEGGWLDSLPRDPPGVTPDDQELQRIEMERRKKLFEATQKVKVAAAPSPASTEAPVKPSNEDKDTSTNGDEEQHRDEPELDEDMFRQWQRMQEEADSSAMEAQAKAQWMCCTTLFQILMVCLLVGKLEHDYPRPVDGSVGYSAYWILFPIFLLAGIVLCCCSVLIFFTGDPNAVYETNDATGTAHGEEPNSQQHQEENGDVTDIYMAPAPTTVAAPAPVQSDVEAPAPAADIPPIAEADDMNDLD